MVSIATDHPTGRSKLTTCSTMSPGVRGNPVAAEKFPSPLVGEGQGGGYTASMSTGQARALRQNRTDAEKRLWEKLRRKRIDGYRFRQQAPIGKYIVDFVCFEAKLVIELDGGQHAIRADQDADRTDWLASQGFRVLRFWNNEVFENIEGVEEVVRAALHSGVAARPLPNPPPSRGRE